MLYHSLGVRLFNLGFRKALRARHGVFGGIGRDQMTKISIVINLDKMHLSFKFNPTYFSILAKMIMNYLDSKEVIITKLS